MQTFLRFGVVLVLCILWSGCAPDNNSTPNYISNARAVLEAFSGTDATPLHTNISAAQYTQHNLSFPDGLESVAGALESGALNGTTVNIIRAFQDGDVVFTHTIYGGTWNNGVPQVAFDVFRFQDGLIVEHWDNLDNQVDDGDGTTQTNGTVQANTNINTETSRTLVKSAIDDLFIAGNWSRLENYFDGANYVQHSNGYGADFTGLKNALGALADGTAFYQSLKYIHAQNDMVLTMSEGLPDATTGLSSAYYDLFRVNNGKIVEHWDVVQTIPPQSEWANANGKW